MLTSIVPKSLNILDHFLRIGSVEEVVDAAQIRVSLSYNNCSIEMWTSFAMGDQALPKRGDKVLVVGESSENGFIIGLFPTAENKKQQFTVERDPKTGKTTLTVAEGDLDLCTKQGSIHLRAAKEITLSSRKFALDTAKGEIKITDASYEGMRLGATIERCKLLLGKLHNTVDRLVEKAKNVYRQVDNLNQIKAGRMRTLVAGSYHLKSERIIEKAEKEVRIDGDKINLG